MLVSFRHIRKLLAAVAFIACFNGHAQETRPDTVSTQRSGYSGAGCSDFGLPGDEVACLALIAVAAVIVSNDFYIYPVVSFRSMPSMAGLPGGWAFGLRRKYEKCALEYGVSRLTFRQYVFSGSSVARGSDGYRWGGHFNFVVEVAKSRRYPGLTAYLGPSVNVMAATAKFGAGGLAGVSCELFDRLKADVRYEYTTTTSQLQAGLIFTYQKKRFWEK
jgi:hypothetical protein